MMLRTLVLAAAGALALLPATAAADKLTPGTEVSFTLPGGSLAPEFHVEVPEGAGALRIEVDSATPGRDLDLVVRSATPFQVGTPADPLTLFTQAQYRSASSRADEFVTITDSGRHPLAPGRWYVGVLNFSGEPAEVRLKATLFDEPPVVPIQIVYDDTSNDCDVGPWNSERRAAMDETARLLTEQLKPRAPVRVQACWRAFDGDGPLANASPQYLVWSDHEGLSMPFLRENYTYYSAAAAAQQAGTSFCRFAGGDCSEIDIRANFNTTAPFYYGLDRNTTPGQVNFITTAMHEVTHGLGFFGLVDVETGERFSLNPQRVYRDAYGSNVRWHKFASPPLPFLEITDAERAEAVTSGNALRFHGPNLRAILGVELRLYAPGVPSQGSTYSHFDTVVLGNELMAHRISANAPHDLGYGLGVLYDVGWDPDPDALPPPVLPRGGQYYDPTRSGHGIAMYRVGGIDNFYFLVFYTYDDAGLPEFYIANGFVVDGVFAPERSENGDSLIRNLYRFDGSIPPGYHDADPAFTGLIRIDFNQADLSPACAGRDGATAVVSFTLPGSANQQWCLQPLADTSTAANDLTNVWLNYDDTGWGLSSLSFGTGEGDGLGMQIYYPDANGEPRWAIMQTAAYVPGETYPLLQARGYCRTCPSQPVVMEPVGSVTVGLESDASGTENPLQFEVSFDGPAGGTFARDTQVVPGGDPEG